MGWRGVLAELNIVQSTAAAHQLKQTYLRFLYPFEKRYYLIILGLRELRYLIPVLRYFGIYDFQFNFFFADFLMDTSLQKL